MIIALDWREYFSRVLYVVMFFNEISIDFNLEKEK